MELAEADATEPTPAVAGPRANPRREAAPRRQEALHPGSCTHHQGKSRWQLCPQGPVSLFSRRHPPFLRLSFRLRCLLTKQAARVLNRMAAARKQMVATMPASTGRASPSSVRSGCGKMSEGIGVGVGGGAQVRLFPPPGPQVPLRLHSLRLCPNTEEAAWWEEAEGHREAEESPPVSPPRGAASPGDVQAITHLMTSPGALTKQHAPPGSHAQLTGCCGSLSITRPQGLPPASLQDQSPTG